MGWLKKAHLEVTFELRKGRRPHVDTWGGGGCAKARNKIIKAPRQQHAWHVRSKKEASVAG